MFPACTDLQAWTPLELLTEWSESYYFTCKVCNEWCSPHSAVVGDATVDSSIPISCPSSSGLNIEAAMKPRMEESFTIHLGVCHLVKCRRRNHFTITVLHKFPLHTFTSAWLGYGGVLFRKVPLKHCSKLSTKTIVHLVVAVTKAPVTDSAPSAPLTGAQMKTMHNLRLICCDTLDLCRHELKG